LESISLRLLTRRIRPLFEIAYISTGLRSTTVSAVALSRIGARALQSSQQFPLVIIRRLCYAFFAVRPHLSSLDVNPIDSKFEFYYYRASTAKKAEAS
jgi:hypothetical protein